MENNFKAKKRYSINDVAKFAGVSVSTVSRAINSVGYIKQETKEKILKAVEELDYVPDRAGITLKSRRTKLIMLAIPDTSNEIYFGMIEGVQQKIKEYGYSLLLYYTNGLLEEELQSVKLLQEKLTDGLILVHFSYSETLYKEIEKCSAPIVLIGMCNHLWACKSYKFDTISIDVYSGIFQTVEHLIRMGHKKIGYLAGPKGLEVYNQRLAGYCDALKKYGLDYRENYVMWNDYTEAGGYSSGRILFQLEDRPTAICASNDLQAIGCWEAINDVNGNIPNSIALTGIDNLNISKKLKITSCDMKETVMGGEAAKLLLLRLTKENLDLKYKDLYFKPELNIRDSSMKIFRV